MSDPSEGRRILLRQLTAAGVLAAGLFALKQAGFYAMIASLPDTAADDVAIYRGYLVVTLAGLALEIASALLARRRALRPEAVAAGFVRANAVFLFASMAFVFRIYGGFFTLLLLPACFVLVTLAAVLTDPMATILVAAVVAAGHVALLLFARRAGWLPEGPLLFELAAALLLVVHGGMVAVLAGERIRHEVSITRLTAAAERSRIIEIFGQQVSPAVVDKLLAQKGRADSELREVCVMFLDIRGFTTFSESRKPEEIVRYLNALWSFMVDSVNLHHGIVNKFLGDGFMATFGAPLDEGNHCENAIRAAQEILAETERAVADGRVPPTRIGIGLHAGTAVTGNVGSTLRKEYSVIGDVVNLASRIESMNKEFGSQLLASREVLSEAGAAAPVPTKNLGSVKLRGHGKELDLVQLA